MRFIKILSLAAAVMSVSGISAQIWEVPGEQKAVTAPFMFTADMQKQGEQIYLKNCQSCHGLPGKDNWVKLTPSPGDLAKEKTQSQTDGELFYRITAGKAPMPEFRNIIPEEERWWVVAYLRTFLPGYVQPAPLAKTAFAGRTVTLTMEYKPETKKIEVKATEKNKEGQVVPAAGVEVILFVKRYFGKLQVGEIRTTNASGLAFCEFPSDLPGNKDGYVEISAVVNDPKGVMRTTPASAVVAIGAPTDLPSLTATRAWWSTRDRAPVWIILTYTGSVIIVWAFILYILYMVIGIRKLGKTPS